jgi:hypothetical protein
VAKASLLAWDRHTTNQTSLLFYNGGMALHATINLDVGVMPSVPRHRIVHVGGTQVHANVPWVWWRASPRHHLIYFSRYWIQFLVRRPGNLKSFEQPLQRVISLKI